jgi:hypothetical protein
VWSTVAAVAVSVGCGGSGSGDISLADLPAAVTSRYCPIEVHCGRYPDEATCRTASRSSLGQLQADVTAGTIKYDGAQAAACLAAVANETRDCRTSQMPGPPPPSCLATFTGTLPPGGACLSNEECASGACDLSSCAAACCRGSCMPGMPSQIPLGGTCTGAAGTCVAGAFCDTSTTPFQCVPVLPAGSPCTDPDSCAAGLACLGSTRVCGALAGEGAPCMGEGTCDLLTDFCDSTTSTCKPRLGVGSDCDPNNDGCVGYGFCDQTTSKCVALGRVGEPCAVNIGPGVGCLPDLECVNNTCDVPPVPPVCP